MNRIVVVGKSSDLIDCSKDLNDFFQLYLLNFPDPDEREDPQIICDRIRLGKDLENSPETFILLVLTDDKVSGGAVLEYYLECRCFLLTYIVVDKEQRGNKIARYLVETGIKSVIDAKGSAVEALFFESNIPWKTDAQKDSFDAWSRYHVFSKLGAKWLEMDYTQPSLGAGKKRVDHLHLFLFPSLTNLEETISKKVVKSFLSVFYRSLGIQLPELDEDFLGMMKSIGEEVETLPLKEVPTNEQKHFLFRDVSVAYHLNEEPSESAGAETAPSQTHCPVIGSFELDLFKFRYQDDPPFETHCKKETTVLHCDLIFPDRTSYLSEGRYETLRNPDPRVSFELRLNHSLFRNGRKIWTIVLVPMKGQSVGEDQIVKLIALFNRSSEHSNIKAQTRFEFEGKEFNSFESMARSITGVKSLKLLRSGIVQADFSSSSSLLFEPELWKEMIASIGGIARNQESELLALEKRYKEEEVVARALNLMCGFSLGIFDYKRMTFEEVMETLLPLTSGNSSCVLMNKGLLASLNYADESYVSSKSNVGISPYLLIASMLLAYNEVETATAERLLDEVLGSDENTLSFLIQQRKLVERKLNEDILINVFHYPGEQKIFSQGMGQRGIDDRILNIRSRMGDLILLIRDKDARLKAKFEKMGVIFLAWISILSFEPVFNDVYQSMKNATANIAWLQKEGFKWIYFFVFAIIAFFLIRYFVFKSIKDSSAIADKRQNENRIVRLAKVYLAIFKGWFKQ